MQQMLMYTVTAIVLYVVSDRILIGLEKWRGKPFVSRSIVFFMIIMILSVTTFEAIQHFFTDVLPSGPAAMEQSESMVEPIPGSPMPEPLRSPALPPVD